MFTKQKINNDTTILIAITLTLITVGVIFVYSSSSFYALEHFGSPFYYVKRQILGILLGSVFFYCARSIPLHIIQQTSLYFYTLSLGASAIPIVSNLSRKMHGSSRWLRVFGFTFQPSEILKIAVIVYIASFLARKQEHRHSFLKGYLPPLVILMLTSIILLKQPDFGCTVTILATAFIMFFIAKMNMKYLMILSSIALPLGGILIYFKRYRLARVLTFLDPWKDPQGAGFQIIQSLIAIGSGGWWGNGIAQSKQKFLYLPMQHTDFIFAIIAEETGFIGTTLLITLFALFLYFCFKISWQLKDLFAVYLVQGLAILVTLQAIINITVSTGLAPTKGIGLPFISYGNTALACNMLLVGIIVNAAYDFYE